MAPPTRPDPSMSTEATFASMNAMAAKISPDGSQTPVTPFACGMQAFTSTAPLPTCPEACSTCAGHYLPIAWQKVPFLRRQVTHDDAEAASQIQNLTTAINDDIAHVKQMIHKYGNAIVKRWQKRNSDKRADLLLKAMPELCKHKWASAHIHFEQRRNLDAANKKTSDIMAMSRRTEALHLLSYLDVPTLSWDANTLLSLLQNRTSSDPAEWVMFDYEQVKLVYDASFHAEVAYNPHCVSMLHDSFGQLVHWDEQSAHAFHMIGYPRARLMLKAQAKLLGFLRRMADLILQNGVDETSQGRDLWDKTSANGIGQRTSPGSELSRVSPAFSAPPKLDLERVVSTLRSRRNATADILWLLQVDPQYTRDHLTRIKNTPYYQKSSPQQRPVVLADSLIQPLLLLSMWQYLVDVSEDALRIQSEDRQQNQDKNVLSAEYDLALRKLHCCLEQQVPGMVEGLRNIVHSTGTFSNFVKRTPDGQKWILTTKKREDVFKKDPLAWNVIELFEYDHVFSLDLSWHVAFIDDVLSKAPVNERAHIHTNVYTHLSNMTAVSDAIAALRCNMSHHGPKLDQRLYCDLDDNPAKKDYYTTLDLVEYLMSPDRYGAENIYAALHNFLRLPMPTAKVTDSSYSQVHDLHEGLIGVWREVRNRVAHPFALSSKKAEGLARLNRFLKPISAHSTPAYTVQREDELRSVCLNKVQRAVERPETSQPELALKAKDEQRVIVQTSWGSVEGVESLTQQLKEKLKTRPSTTNPAALPALAIGEPQNEVFDEKTTDVTPIAVSRASKIVLTSMYAAAADMRSNTRWEHFVSALTDAGFSATHNGGSAVTFRDEKPQDNSGGAIVLHRPHPDPSIDPVMLRSFGKRFKKWFGWDAATFVERK